MNKILQNQKIHALSLLLVFKTKSDKKFSNFSFYWTEAMYQNNFRYFTVLFTFFFKLKHWKQFPKATGENKFQISEKCVITGNFLPHASFHHTST